MNFKEAFEVMKSGKKVKRPHWGGYWSWDNLKGTIIMHTKEGVDIDLFHTERKDYTLENIAADDFIVC